jgi:hypothetical protein
LMQTIELTDWTFVQVFSSPALIHREQGR